MARKAKRPMTPVDVCIQRLSCRYSDWWKDNGTSQVISDYEFDRSQAAMYLALMKELLVKEMGEKNAVEAIMASWSKPRTASEWAVLEGFVEARDG